MFIVGWSLNSLFFPSDVNHGLPVSASEVMIAYLSLLTVGGGGGEG